MCVSSNLHCQAVLVDLVGFPINRHLAAVPQRFPTATSHRLATLLSWGALLRIVTGDHDDTFEDRASWFSTTTFHFYNGAESIDGDSGGVYCTWIFVRVCCSFALTSPSLLQDFCWLRSEKKSPLRIFFRKLLELARSS